MTATRNNIDIARRLRQSANAPEQIAWEVFRSYRKLGYPVRRQHPIGNYVVDFAVVKEKLVIEIDGGVHDLPAVKARDMKRENDLIRDGWRMLRIPAKASMSRDHLHAMLQKELGL
ncbi:MAG: DUF559 domain-containing protein [Parvularculaceae bacterium]|nr:DUF559 domain-containing protein [Parvularculaceae bacterium]